MALYGGQMLEKDQDALPSILAHRMLQEDSGILSQTGFLVQGSGSDKYRHFCFQDARELREHSGDGWEKQVQRADAVVSRLQNMSGGVSRFFSDLQDPSTVIAKLVVKLQSDRGFRFLANWLVTETLNRFPDVMLLPLDEFASKTVPLNENVLREAVGLQDPGHASTTKQGEAAAINELLDSAVTNNLIHMESMGV